MPTNNAAQSLRRRREWLKLSQQEVASAIGKTQTWLSYLEAGKRNPRLSDLDLLLRELDMALTLRTLPDASKELRHAR